MTDFWFPAFTVETTHSAPLADVRRPEAATMRQEQSPPTLKVTGSAGSVLLVTHRTGAVWDRQVDNPASSVPDGVPHAVPVTVQPVPATVGIAEHLLPRTL
jgi:hypothetical protein